jgi:hypothetical protein
VTQVTGKLRTNCALLALLLSLVGGLRAQSLDNSTLPTNSASASDVSTQKPAEALYLKLQSVGLDPARAYHIRDVSIVRPALQILLEDGEIAFTADVAGRVTGAFFEGDGELLLTPPNQVERASMTLFTGMAILEERFSSAYFRFNDNTFAELQPYLRPAQDPNFSLRWNDAARSLAEQDALRLLASFSRFLPPAGETRETPISSPVLDPTDRLLHARVQGRQLGAFDVYFDTRAVEEVWAGQTRNVESLTYYDLWTSFTPTKAGSRGKAESKERSDDVVVSQYKIRAQVEPPTTLHAEALLHAEAKHAGERTLYFELSRYLQVKEVEVDRHPVEFIDNPAIDGTQLSRRGNDLVAVVLPDSLRVGQKLDLRFVYSGDVLSEAGGGLLYVGARGTWYPNRGLLRADFDLEFRYPPGWTLVATGKKVPSGTVGAGAGNEPAEQTARWVTEEPSVLAGFNLGRYDRAVAHADHVMVEAYAARAMEKAFPRPPNVVVAPPPTIAPLPGTEPMVLSSIAPSPARNAQAVADNGARALDFFSQHFGPYPYSSLELTQMPGRTSQGWPGLVFLSSFSFLTPQQTTDLGGNSLESAMNSLVLSHEIAHQWWGDLVGWRSYRDQWMVEALANYSALMLMETTRPGDAKTILAKYRDDLLEKNANGESLRDAGPVTLGLRLNSSHFPNGYEAVSYGRGTWLFHMLRNMLLDAESGRPSQSRAGTEEPFLRDLRKVRERYAGKAITTRELFSVFEEDLPRSLWYEGRKSLDWFVQGWVEGVALPHFSTHNVKFSKKANGTEVTGTIVEKDAPTDLVSAVPVYAVATGKPRLLGTVLVDEPNTPFRFAVPPDTRKIVLDPFQTMLTATR